MRMLDAPSPPAKLSRLNLVGLLIFVFGVLGFVVWATFTPLDSAVVAQGVVKVGSEKKQVQHLEGGIVKALHVKEGDAVKAGQVLLSLDGTFAGTDYAVLNTQIQELQVREALLIAQRDNTEALIFPDYLNTSDSSSWISQQKKSAQLFYQFSKDALNSQIDVISAQIAQIRNAVTGHERDISSKQERLAFMEEEAASWENLLQNKYANKLRYLELKGEISELKGDVEQIRTKMVSANKQIQELEFEQNRVLQAYREGAAKELIEVQLGIKDLSERIDSAGNVLDRVELRAPVDGKVVGLSVHTLGAVIRPGDTILEIVPEKDELVIGVRVLPIDIDKVQTLMRAKIRISSYKQHEFPEFEGEVDSVSADVFQDSKTLESYYTARITIPEGELNSLPEDKINPGMPAEVMIITGESTPAQYLLDPLLSAFRSAWRDS